MTSSNSTTSSDWIRVGVEYFVQNSWESHGEEADALNDVVFAWVSIMISALILLHSFQIHRFKFVYIRILSDTCAVGTLLAAVFLLVYVQNPNRLNFVIYINVLYKGVTGLLVQLPDTIVYLLGYSNVKKKVPLLHWVLIWIFILVTMYFSWCPVWFIFPFVMDVNSQQFNENVYPVMGNVQTVATILYDLFFTTHFLYLLYKVNIARYMRIQKHAQIFVIKCCFHFVNSLAAGGIDSLALPPVVVSSAQSMPIALLLSD